MLILRKAAIGCLVVFFLVLKLGGTSEKISLYKDQVFLWIFCKKMEHLPTCWVTKMMLPLETMLAARTTAKEIR